VNLLRWLVTYLLAAVVVGDGVLTIQTWRARSQAGVRTRDVLIRTHLASSPVGLYGNGLSTDGVELASLVRRAPLVLRYASKNCGYCQRDLVWPRLAEAMRVKGVRVAVLLPRAAEAFDSLTLVPRSAPQVAFVSTEWLKQFRLTTTPTVMLFNSVGDLIWAQQGMLGADSIDRALRALDEGVR
jgi:hypothetical protein